MNTITANDLKTKGVGVFKEALKDEPETIISVHGKPSYVVMSIENYNHYRECELEAAILESNRDIAEGHFHEGTVDEHIRRVTDGA